jgi:hypothetical protein
MAECRAVSAGFSATFKRPSLFIAEVAWRWAFTAAAWLLIAYGILLFLKSVPVSDADMFGLSGIIPSRIAPTVVHILAGSGPKMVRLGFALLIGTSFLSWIAYSLGRTAVLRSLLPNSRSRAMAPVFRLNLLRTVCLVFVILAYAGCIFLLAHSSTPQDQARPVSGTRDYSLLFIALALVLAWLWRRINARLTLANVFTVRSGAGVMDSILRATDVSLRRLRQFAWIGVVFGFLKLIVTVAAFFGVFMVFSIFAPFSVALAWLAVIGVLMAYSALANFFSVGALAAQVRVIEWDEQEHSPSMR